MRPGRITAHALAVLGAALLLSVAPAAAGGASGGTPASSAVTVSTPAATQPGAAGAPATPAAPAPGVAAKAPAAGARPHSQSRLSTGAIVAAVIAGLVALACLVWALARMQAYEPRWTLSLRHAVAEAGFRASSTWEEFSDWIRTGR